MNDAFNSDPYLAALCFFAAGVGAALFMVWLIQKMKKG